MAPGRRGRGELFGNAGADTFDFDVASDSAVGAQRDVIGNFAHGLDRIDVSPIDVRVGQAGNQAFIGGGQFDGEGQIRVAVIDGKAVLQLNTAGTSGAEMEIGFNNLTSLTVDDFIL